MISSDDEALKAGNKYEDEYGTGSSSEEDEEETDGEEGNISSGRRKQASSSSSIKIFARVRPPRSNPSLKHHTSGNSNKKYFIEQTPDGIPKIGFKIPKDETHGIVNNSKENYEFQFDRVFDTDTTQEEVFDVVAKDVVLSVMDGYNGTIFAYGQTGSGKTFTITGGAEKYSDRGIIPRSIQFMFKEAQKRTGYSYEYKISYLEIYNETGYDLLDNSRDAKKLEDLPKVTLQEDENEIIHLKNLSAIPASNEEEALNQLFIGDTNKMIAETPSNPASSRSHCIFIISVMSRKNGEDVIRRSKLHLVDLAGSERVSRTQIDGNLLKEAKYINLSLHYLEQVIVALHQKALGKRTHVPYRNSMMTSVLRDSLGGNCKTTMIATAAVEDPLIEETISTCRFAQRVALISNSVSLNEEMDPQLVIARLKREIARLKAELAIARGEGADASQDLPDYEIQRIKQAVDDYIGDTSSDGALIFSDFRKISEAFRIMKGYILDSTLSKPTSDQTASSSVAAIPSGRVSDDDAKRYLDEIDKLKFLVTHRDNEIKILVGMINQYKEKFGVIKSNAPKESYASSASLESMSDQAGRSPQHRKAAIAAPSPPPSQLAPKRSESSLSNDPSSSMSNNTNYSPSASATLSPEKAKAFEIFKAGYPAGSWIDGQKNLLKGKYADAKQLGERANSMRSEIKQMKEMLASEESTEEGEAGFGKEDMRDRLGQVVSSYKESYQQLKDMKIEIEHLHHLLDQARLRLTRDFEHWYATVYLATAAAPSLFGSGEDLHMNRLRESTNSSISLLSTTTANTTTSTSTTTSAAAATLGRSDSGKHGFDYKGSSDSLSAPNNGASIASKASLAFSTLPIYSTNNSQRPPSRSSSSGQIMGVVSHDRTGSGRFYPSSTSSSSSPAPTLYSSASSSSPSRSNLSSLSSLAADLNHTASVSEKIRLAGLSSSSSSSLPSVNVKEEIDAFYKARSELLQKQHSK